MDLSDEVKARSASGAAQKLAQSPGAEIVEELWRLSPGFAVNVLAELPDEARERAISAAPEPLSHQWQRNLIYAADAVGRMMEPVLAALPPEATVAQTIEALREQVKRGLISYIYVVGPDDKLLGVVTFRDLVFSEKQKTLAEIMLRDVFALRASAPLEEAMKLTLDRHYP